MFCPHDKSELHALTNIAHRCPFGHLFDIYVNKTNNTVEIKQFSFVKSENSPRDEEASSRSL